MELKGIAVAVRLTKAVLRELYALLVIAGVVALIGISILEAAIGSLFSGGGDPVPPVPGPVIMQPAPDDKSKDCVMMPDGVRVCKGKLSKPG